MNGTLFDVLDAVVEEERCFVSRGDASGTHMKEQALWQAWSDDGRGDVIEDDLASIPKATGSFPLDKAWAPPSRWPMKSGASPSATWARPCSVQIR